MGFASVIVILVFIGLIITLIKHFYDIVSALIKYFKKDYFSKYVPPRPLNPRYKSVLAKHFTFYQKLSARDKKHFEGRVQKFIGMKEFIPRGELSEVTDEMKALVAGTAIQITFGYPNIYFEHFWRILLYNDNYYSIITRQYHQGEVNMKGIIVLSWRNFVSGFFDSSNGRNLGFHEMAHALNFENAIKNKEYNYIGKELLDEFTILAHREMDRIRSGQTTFLRDYAGTSIQEFFAISVESFFERPHEFKEYDPQLYLATSRILRQDPTSKS